LVAKNPAFLKEVQPGGYYWVNSFLVRPGFCKKAQLDGFMDFYEFSVIRMSTAG